ncbi:hypothetical protein C8K44_111171, partial [Aminobacter sp. AP02]
MTAVSGMPWRAMLVVSVAQLAASCTSQGLGQGSFEPA